MKDITDEILDLYRVMLSFKRLVLIHIQKKNLIFTITSLIVIPIIIILLIVNLSHDIKYYSLFLILINFLALIKDVKKETVRISKEINHEKSYTELRREGLDDFLMKNNFTSERIEMLIKLFERKKTQFKTSFFIGGGFFLTMFVSLSNSMFSYIFSYYSSMELMWIVFFIVMVLTFFVVIYSTLIKTLYEDIFKANYNRCKLIIDDLYILQLNQKKTSVKAIFSHRHFRSSVRRNIRRRTLI